MLDNKTSESGTGEVTDAIDVNTAAKTTNPKSGSKSKRQKSPFSSLDDL